MTDTTLALSLSGIYSAVNTTLTAEMKTGGKLAGLVTLIPTYTGQIKTPLPALGYYGELMNQPEIQTMGKREVWELPLYLVAICRGDVPLTAMTNANTYAAQARAAIKATDRLGLEYVTGITSGRFLPAQAHNEDRSVFGAVAHMNIGFTATL